MSDQQRDLVKLSGLWENTDKNGDTYYTGGFGAARLVIFRNKRKASDQEPDWILYVSNRHPHHQPDPVNDTDRGDIPF